MERITSSRTGFEATKWLERGIGLSNLRVLDEVSNSLGLTRFIQSHQVEFRVTLLLLLLFLLLLLLLLHNDFCSELFTSCNSYNLKLVNGWEKRINISASSFSHVMHSLYPYQQLLYVVYWFFFLSRHLFKKGIFFKRGYMCCYTCALKDFYSPIIFFKSPKTVVDVF